MAARNLSAPTHEHVFLGANQERNERKVWLVIALTATMMVVEIVAGHVFGSMALIADGWHMSTHAGAMLIAVVAYRYARLHAQNRSFSFGTGKLGDLAAFASAIALALVALLIGWESLVRLVEPVPIGFDQAIMVAIIGLVVNLVSAWLLRDDHAHHHHNHRRSQDHAQGHGHAQDNNLRAAYLHVLADALTSVLAIVALLLGRTYGWYWADPIMGVVGALVISRWSWGLIRDAGSVLLDKVPDANLEEKIREAVGTGENEITDLHVWRIGPGHCAVIVSLVSSDPLPPSDYKKRLSEIHGISHATVEVQPSAA